MRAARDVVSITRLKSEAAELVRQVSEEGRTFVVTQNGAAHVVVMDVAEFDRMRSMGRGSPRARYRVEVAASARDDLREIARAQRKRPRLSRPARARG